MVKNYNWKHNFKCLRSLNDVADLDIRKKTKKKKKGSSFSPKTITSIALVSHPRSLGLIAPLAQVGLLSCTHCSKYTAHITNLKAMGVFRRPP